MKNDLTFLGTCLVSAAALIGCGGSGSDSSPASGEKYTYNLNVSVSGEIDALSIDWMDKQTAVDSGQSLVISAVGEVFSNPALSYNTDLYACQGNLSKTSDFEYSYPVQCELKAEQIQVYVDGVLAYPVTLSYDGQEIAISDEDVSVERVASAELGISALGGPQACELTLVGGKYALSCTPFSLAYGNTPEASRGLYMMKGEQPPSLIWQSNADELINLGYFWFDERAWWSVTGNNGTENSAISLGHTKGTLDVFTRHDISPDALTQVSGSLLALAELENDAQGYRLMKWENNNWEQVIASTGLTPESGFAATRDEVSWYLRTISGTQFYVGRTLNGIPQVPKQVGSQITLVTDIPVYQYQGFEQLVGFDDTGTMWVQALDVAVADTGTMEVGEISTVNLFENAQDNQYLLYMQAGEVKQLDIRNNDVPGSEAFDLSTVNELTPDWIGGDKDIFLAGQSLSESQARLLYAYSADGELGLAALQERLSTQGDIKVKHELNLLDGRLRYASSIRAHKGHILVFTGEDAGGSVWVISATNAYKVMDDISWPAFETNFAIEAVSEHHIIVHRDSSDIISIPR